MAISTITIPRTRSRDVSREAGGDVTKGDVTEGDDTEPVAPTLTRLGSSRRPEFTPQSYAASVSLATTNTQTARLLTRTVIFRNLACRALSKPAILWLDPAPAIRSPLDVCVRRVDRSGGPRCSGCRRAAAVVGKPAGPSRRHPLRGRRLADLCAAHPRRIRHLTALAARASALGFSRAAALLCIAFVLCGMGRLRHRASRLTPAASARRQPLAIFRKLALRNLPLRCCCISLDGWRRARHPLFRRSARSRDPDGAAF